MPTAKFWRLLSDPSRLRRAIARRLAPELTELGPSRIYPGRYAAQAPDRYAINLAEYLARGGTDCAKTQSQFILGNEERNSGDLPRYYFLKLVCDQILTERITGDYAELGVYKGNTAALLADLARRTGSRVYLFDTFSGFASDDLVEIDRNIKIEFADTSLDAAKQLVGGENVKFVQGYFPATAEQIPVEARFALVHLDCDLYKPFSAALEFFYPRLVPGGFLIMHDYGSLFWDGVKKAVDDFFADKSERVIPIPDKSGTAVVRKVSK